MEKVHIGTMGWSYDFWIGNFYPEGSDNLLGEYSKNFDTVEINNTFYRIPSRDTVRNWKSLLNICLYWEISSDPC